MSHSAAGLSDASELARLQGFAVVAAGLDEILEKASRLGWTPVPVRRGESAVTAIRPVAAHRAKLRSLSPISGLGQQPLHTDGAHLLRPPDFVILDSLEKTSTPTFVLPWQRLVADDAVLSDAATHGVFRVDGGTEKFFAMAEAKDTLRYDPGCMTPCDARSRLLVRTLEIAKSSADPHCWQGPGESLLIDNRKTLHARGRVDGGNLDRCVRRVAFYVKGLP